MAQIELHYIMVAGFNYYAAGAKSDIYGEMALNRLRRLFGEGDPYGGQARIGEHDIPDDARIVITLMSFRRRDKHGFPAYRGEADQPPPQVLQTVFHQGDPRPDFEDESVWEAVPAFRDRLGVDHRFIEDKKFDPDRVPDESPHVMSIVDVYRLIYALAERKRKGGRLRILELSIFSHSSIVGPIMVNSYDRRPRPKNLLERAHLDKDGRSLIDFNHVFYDPLAQSMTETAATMFEPPDDEADDETESRFWELGDAIDELKRWIQRRGAAQIPGRMNYLSGASGVFHSEAECWLWGCNAQRKTRQLILKFMKNAKNSGSLAGKTVRDDSPKIRIRFGRKDGKRYYTSEPVTMQRLQHPYWQKTLQALGPNIDAGITEAELAEVNRRIKGGGWTRDISLKEMARLTNFEWSYGYGLARTFRVKTYTALPGTWAALQSRRLKAVIPYPLTEVPTSDKLYSDGKGGTKTWAFDKIIEFYADHYRITFDEETSFGCLDPRNVFFDDWR